MGSPERKRLGYVVSQYPAYSHVFIEREVQGLRRLGWAVSVYSLKPSGVPGHPENDTVTCLAHDSWAKRLLGAVRLLLGNPPAAVKVVRVALSNEGGRRRGWRGYAKQLAYVINAVTLHKTMTARGEQHIHVHFANNAADVADLCTRFGRTLGRGPTTWSLALHGPSDLGAAQSIGLARKVASASLVTCISNDDLDRLIRLQRSADPSKYQIVRMGVADPMLEGVLPPRRSAGRELRVCFVGRLVEQKCPAILLSAVALLARSRSECQYFVNLVGDGPLRTQLEQQASALPANVRVEFAGAQPQAQVQAMLRDSDVFCLPSRREGLPVALMEALALGVPAVATRIFGVPELIEDQVTGLLVEPDDPEATADAMQRLLFDDDLRDRCRIEGRKRVATMHRSSANAEALGKLLRPFTQITEHRGDVSAAPK